MRLLKHGDDGLDPRLWGSPPTRLDMAVARVKGFWVDVKRWVKRRKSGQ